MKTCHLALLNFALFLAMGWPSLHADGVTPDPFQPAKFTYLAFEKRDGNTVITIQLDTDADAIVYRKTVDRREVERAAVHPTSDDWLNFVQTINQAKLYLWTSSYYYPGHGPVWKIDLNTADRTFHSEGANEYPKEQTEDQPQADPKAGPSVPYKLFWQAALTLVGKTETPAPAK